MYSLAGRFRDRYLADPAFAGRERRKLAFAPWYTRSKEYSQDRSYPVDANTGVVGFTINLVDRTVSLVAPRPSSDAFPLGFETLDRLRFTDSERFADALDTLIRRWMPERLAEADKVQLWDGLRCEAIADGVRLHGRFGQFTEIVDADHALLIQSIAAALTRGATVGDIQRANDADPDLSTTILHRFFVAGLLQEIRIND